MNKIELAIAIARKAHKGQKDKLGEDYINHPMRVHRNLLSHPGFKSLDAQSREDAEVAAIMHDVIEDSGKNGSEVFTREDLMAQRFTPRSIELIELLTRVKTVPDDVYYANINANELARLVKWADIADNQNEVRVAGLETQKAKELKEKYEHALEVIVMSENDKSWLADAVKHPVDLEWDLANESAEAESDLQKEQDVYPEVDGGEEEG